MDHHMSTCPFCHLPVPSLELERHANIHFEDEGLERDIELAKQISLATSIPPVNLVDSGMPSENNNRKIPESRLSGCESSSSGAGGIDIGKKVSYLITHQTKEKFVQVIGGLMALLQSCLERDSENSTSILSGYIDHFQAMKSEDRGWGCGWRNIQMLSSYLLKQRQEAREVLFGGSDFVPDIASLQRWLELSWKRGFDVLGSNEFDSEIYGKKKWIGTPECAALFRSFGLRARIVDFSSKGMNSKSSMKAKQTQVSGPMDQFVFRWDHITLEVGDGGHGKTEDSGSHNGNVKGHQVLIDWVWNYFSENRSIELNKHQVVVSEKSPLYFQHHGHSRTIIGIQVKNQRNGMPQYTLLILDPGHRTQDLERSLRNNNGWQKLIKRGVHTLNKPQYQLCYIDPGIAGTVELEKLKTLDSNHIEF